MIIRETHFHKMQKINSQAESLLMVYYYKYPTHNRSGINKHAFKASRQSFLKYLRFMTIASTEGVFWID